MCKTKNFLVKTTKNATIKALCSLNPVSAAIDAFRTEFIAASEKVRQDYWEEEFIKRISDIDGIEEKIRSYSNFASLFASATYGAYTDIEAEKVPLYVNVVINAIKNEDINDTKKHIFLNFLRDLTLLHIKLLTFLKEAPKRIPSTEFMRHVNAGPTPSVLDVFIEESSGTGKDIINIVTKDLASKDLINIGNLSNSLLSFGKAKEHLTPFGKQFLEFIKDNEIK